MKAVYHKKSQSVSYVCNDSTTIEIVNNGLVCRGDDVGTNIYPHIAGANDFTIIENVTPPEGYRNSKYTINQVDGEWVWSLNLKWEDVQLRDKKNDWVGKSVEKKWGKDFFNSLDRY